MLRKVYIFVVMTSVILSGGMKMSVGHGMLSEVYMFVMISNRIVTFCLCPNFTMFQKGLCNKSF